MQRRSPPALPALPHPRARGRLVADAAEVAGCTRAAKGGVCLRLAASNGHLRAQARWRRSRPAVPGGAAMARARAASMPATAQLSRHFRARGLLQSQVQLNHGAAAQPCKQHRRPSTAAASASCPALAAPPAAFPCTSHPPVPLQREKTVERQMFSSLREAAAAGQCPVESPCAADSGYIACLVRNGPSARTHMLTPCRHCYEQSLDQPKPGVWPHASRP